MPTINLPPLPPLELDPAKPPKGLNRRSWSNKLRGILLRHQRDDPQAVYDLVKARALTVDDGALVLQARRQKWSGGGDPAELLQTYKMALEDYLEYRPAPPKPRPRTLWQHLEDVY